MIEKKLDSIKMEGLYMNRMSMLLLTLALLALLGSCASPVAGSETSPSPLPEATDFPSPSPSLAPSQRPSPSPSPTPSPTPEPTLVLETLVCDMDGDGTEETVLIKSAREYGEVVYVEFTCGGETFLEQVEPFNFNFYGKTLPVDLDRDGGDELVVHMGYALSGGWGNDYISILTFKDGAIARLPVPGPTTDDGRAADDLLGVSSGGKGFSAGGRLLPGLKAEIFVEETGFTQAIDLTEEHFPDYDLQGNPNVPNMNLGYYYGENGELLHEDTEFHLDWICGMTTDPDKGTITIAQYFWYSSHINGVGFLVSELTYGEDGYEVLSQRLEGDGFDFEFSEDIAAR